MKQMDFIEAITWLAENRDWGKLVVVGGKYEDPAIRMDKEGYIYLDNAFTDPVCIEEAVKQKFYKDSD